MDWLKKLFDWLAEVDECSHDGYDDNHDSHDCDDEGCYDDD